MATAVVAPLRPAATARAVLRSCARRRTGTVIRPPPRATFFNLPNLPNPFGGSTSPSHDETVVNVTLRIPYPAEALFSTVSHVDNYSRFVPYCQQSRVTAWRDVPRELLREGESFTRLPSRADLVVGWGPVTETYTSRLYCVPYRVIEAISGKAGPSITPDEARDIGVDLERENSVAARDSSSSSSSSGIFESLVTRWTFKEAQAGGLDGPSHKPALTDVGLTIRFKFNNPLYQAAAAQMADDIAEKMIKAFEQTAKEHSTQQKKIDASKYPNRASGVGLSR